MKHWLVATVTATALVISGCGAKLDTSSAEAYAASVKKISESLPSEKRQQFAEEFRAVSLASLQRRLVDPVTGARIDGNGDAFLNGKTADDIHKIANALQKEKLKSDIALLEGNLAAEERVLADREAFAAESSSVLSKITIDPPYKIAIRETASGNSTRYFADLSVTNSSPYPIRSGVIAFKFDGGKYTHDLRSNIDRGFFYVDKQIDNGESRMISIEVGYSEYREPDIGKLISAELRSVEAVTTDVNNRIREFRGDGSSEKSVTSQKERTAYLKNEIQKLRDQLAAYK